MQSTILTHSGASNATQSTIHKTINVRSMAMQKLKSIMWGLVALAVIATATGRVSAQSSGDLVITSLTSFQTGTGTITVKGNIVDQAAAPKPITGTVVLGGTATQKIGVNAAGTAAGTSGAIQIEKLTASNGFTNTYFENGTVSGTLTVSAASTKVDIGANVLTLGGAITNATNTTGAITG